MQLDELIALTKATVENRCDDTDYNINVVFASDLMSDALALIRSDYEDTLMLTGLCNAQSLRTAEMLDIRVILFVRDKKISEADLALAKSMNLTILRTKATMYETCGLLFQAGLPPIDDK